VAGSPPESPGDLGFGETGIAQAEYDSFNRAEVFSVHRQLSVGGATHLPDTINRR
jgi:hypothetical protein